MLSGHECYSSSMSRPAKNLKAEIKTNGPGVKPPKQKSRSVQIPPDPVTLHKLRIRDLRALEEINVDFKQGRPGEGQWTLLLGDNGVGKSTILRAIALASVDKRAAGSMLSLAGAAPLIRDEAEAAHVHLELSTGEIDLSLLPGPSSEEVEQIRKPDDLPPPIFAYGCHRGTALGDPQIDFRPVDDVRTLFENNTRLMHAETWLLRRRVAALRHKGSELDFFDAVRQTLVDTLHGVEEIDVDENGAVFFGPKIGRISLAAMSDSYITTVGWLVDLIARWSERCRLAGVELSGDFRKQMTGLVLIDEIDLHLHPQWQTEIVSTLRTQFPKLSFVATTHNPLTLLGARPGEVHVLWRSQEDQRITIHQIDIPPGLRADQVLTGEWFGLASTVDFETREMLARQSQLKARGIAADDPERQALDAELRRRLGSYAETSVERLVHGVALEIIDGRNTEELTPQERRELREKILAAAQAEM